MRHHSLVTGFHRSFWFLVSCVEQVFFDAKQGGKVDLMTTAAARASSPLVGSCMPNLLKHSALGYFKSTAVNTPVVEQTCNRTLPSKSPTIWVIIS